MIYTIPDKKIANIIVISVILDLILYGGNLISNPFHNILLVLVIMVIKNLILYNNHNVFYNNLLIKK